MVRVYYFYNEKELIRPIVPREDKAVNTSPLLSSEIKPTFVISKPVLHSRPRKKSKPKLLDQTKVITKSELEALLQKKPEKILRKLPNVDMRKAKAVGSNNTSMCMKKGNLLEIIKDTNKKSTKSFLEYGAVGYSKNKRCFDTKHYKDVSSTGFNLLHEGYNTDVSKQK